MDALRTHSQRPPPLRALRSTSRGPVGPGSDPDLEELLRTSSGRRLRCRFCHCVVTSEGHRIEIDGRHVHRRINPEGFEFEFGCFAEAVGTAVVGRPTARFSWFTGYTWEYLVCRGCNAHLGWRFAGQDPRFHGLILDRLEIEDET